MSEGDKNASKYGDNRRARRPGPFKKGRRREVVASEFDYEVIHIKKVTKVVKGGRRFRFSVIVVAGNRKGKVGYGVGKANEVPDAVKKARKQAEKQAILIPMTAGTQTLPHEIYGKKSASCIFLKPAVEGTGIVAGGSVRLFLELAGIRNIYTKAFKARNRLNMILATIDAIKKIRSRQEIASMREKKVSEIASFAKR